MSRPIEDIQYVRNRLSAIEDEARQARNKQSDPELESLFNLIAQLTQIVREEIVQ